MMLARRIQRLVRGNSSVPNLVVAQRVIDKMSSAADLNLQDETGESMVGLLIPSSIPTGVPTLYVLDTIAPDESAQRQFAKFEQGDDFQGDCFQWLRMNWDLEREKQRASLIGAFTNKWDSALIHVGDWHKQPGYMIHPSGGDLMTALDYLEDNELDFLLAPIVTLGHPSTIDTTDAHSNFILVNKGPDDAMRIDFWYIDARGGMFLPISPVVYPNDQLPRLPEYPWHLKHPKLAEEEFGLMQDDRLALSITNWQTDDELPLKVCVLTMRMGAPKMLILVLPHDFPKRPARLRVAPVVRMGDQDTAQTVFEKAWAQSEPVDLPYSAAQYPTLLAYVHAAENQLGIERAASNPPAPAPDGEEQTP